MLESLAVTEAGFSTILAVCCLSSIIAFVQGLNNDSEPLCTYQISILAKVEPLLLILLRLKTIQIQISFGHI